ncbi:MAG: glycosyltransferase family 2 protein [Deltaproteobacteria bacterium]|uniref:Glycosyltransferase family 2 protein n=1 Tax=Candidatus Desulfacyla euxinica TaxID=2841693 RepID=A0A8J6MZ36_9DELT|nr:glycosyltransferase family 2 protein [Candidatus Desulfacyla euxinica]MBL7217581.1 glycosyltransferase family 2 protein [Desulfobacteraceae bacterium]
MEPANSPYVLITAARNEEAYIGRTIDAVISQNQLPKKWIIIDDGSTDSTADIVSRYSAQNPFMELISVSGDKLRNFGSKAKSVNFAYRRMRGISYDFVGNLDADVSFDLNYYENILSRFRANPKLGVAGGVRYDLHDSHFIKVKSARNSVGGPFQLFRRECFEEIGGYLPLKYGGIDATAEIMARMHGWEVQSFPEYRAYHYRRTGTASRNFVKSRIRMGIRDYLIGYHPLFQIFRCIFRLDEKPYVISALIWISGFLWAALMRMNRPVSDEFVKFLRSEQLKRIRSLAI